MNEYTLKTYYGANGTIKQIQHIVAIDMLEAINLYILKNLEGYVIIDSMKICVIATPYNFEKVLFPKNHMDRITKKITFKCWVPVNDSSNNKQTICVKVRLTNDK